MKKNWGLQKTDLQELPHVFVLTLRFEASGDGPTNDRRRHGDEKEGQRRGQTDQHAYALREK